MARYDHTNKSDGQTLSASEWNAIGNALEQDSIAPGIVVASNDSPAWMKAAAHYVCDGTADDVEIQDGADYYREWRLADADASAVVEFNSAEDLGDQMYRDELIHFLDRVRWGRGSGWACDLPQALKVLEACA